jgi:tetratricopeptide (TPR) repeat protein
LYDERQYDEVVGVSTEVLKKESDNTDALLLRGRAYYKLEDLGHAQQDFARILGTDPDNPNAYDGLGVIQAKSNRLEEAIAFYDLAIALNGTDFLVFYHRGLTYHLAGNDSLAISDFEKAVELNPMHADSYLGLGIAHIDSGEYEVGAQFCSTAIDLNPDFSLAYYNRGLAHLLQDQIDEAISDYTIAIELGLSIPNVYNGRGRAYLQSRNIELAISDLEYALELDPHFIKASEALQEARQMLSELDTLDDTP